MKKLYIPFILLVLFATWSCEDDNNDLIAKLNSNPVLSELENNNIVISEENSATKITTIAWEEADYNYSAAINYVIEIDKAGNDFADATEIAKTTKNNIDLTGSELNELLSNKGAFPTLKSNYEVKVTASIHDAVETSVSNIIEFGATVYDPNIPAYPFYYIASGYPSWDWTKSFYIGDTSEEPDGKYEGFAYLTKGSFELVLGSDLSQTLGGSTKAVKSEIAEDGFYKINADSNTGEISSSITSWGIIGGATAGGWDSDQDMQLDTKTGIWSATLKLSVGEIKFRANDAWDLNYGDNDADGSLEEGSANIKVEAEGTYMITLDLTKAGKYSYTMTAGSVAPSSKYLYIPGGHNGWNSALDSIASPKQNGIFSGYLYMPANNEFKFFDNGSWIGDAGDGLLGGDPNLTVADAGYYLMKANLNDNSWSATATTWGMIGPAQAGAWDADTDLVYNQETDLWEATIVLSPGEFKFRANDAWDINYGDTGVDGILEPSGDNITLATGGTYKVTLSLQDDVNGYTYTLTLQ